MIINLTPPFKVICINAKDRPNEIPASMWIVENREYTVTETIKCNPQGGLVGFKLAEVELKNCDPYQYYACTRFAPLMPDEVLEKALAKEEVA